MFWTKNKVSTRKVILSVAVLCLAALGLIAGAQFNSTNASTAATTSVAVAPAATFPGTNTGAIPDAPVGGTACGDYGTGVGREISFNVTGMAGPLTDVQVSFTGTHTWVGDLEAELRSPGATATKLLFRQVGGTTATACGDDSDLGGAYNFSDAASSTFWTAATSTTGPVPVGTYRAVTPLVNTATPITSAFTGLTTPQINGTWVLRVRDGGEGDLGSISAATLTLTGGAAPTGDAPVDFDGDGRSDYVVVRNVGGGASGQVRWFIGFNNTANQRAADWGLATDFFVSEDFDNDNKDDIAVWRPGAATVAAFYILNSNGNTVRVEAFGQTGDDPTVVDDYNNDGSADLAVYRGGASAGMQSTWFFRTTPGGPVNYMPWGMNGDFPAPGDYDGDGSADFVVQRNAGGGQAAFWRNLTTAADDIVIFGTPTDVIVPGDYDGDGKTDLATIRGIGGSINWFYDRSDTAGVSPIQTVFGASATDFPVQGDYDGDGRTDFAVWRAGVFWHMSSATSTVGNYALGAGGDYPVANFNAH